MSLFQDKFLNPLLTSRADLQKRAELYNSKKSKTREFLNFAKETSSQELKSSVGELGKNFNLKNLLALSKTGFNSSTWLSIAFIRHIHGLIDFSQKNLTKKYEELSEPRMQMILKLIQEGVAADTISDQELFKVIYNELEFAYHNPIYESPLKMPDVNLTLMLVSGVLNEVFSTPAFDRGAQHLLENHGIKYLHLEAKGTKGSDFNSLLLKEQIRDYLKENPKEKVWIVGFSKGGLDILHYLADDAKFANKHILGFSGIASPIMGTEHLSHWILRAVNSIHKFSDTRVYKYFDDKVDIFAKEVQKSLSEKYLKKWFEENHERLPKNIFYTAVAFESSWFESHAWMKLAKIIFKSNEINDGVVDAKNAFFPDYFKSKRLGIIKGHHLVGNRSSYYSQEALLEAHLLFLHLKGLI